MPRQGITPIDVLADNPRYRTRYGAGNVPVERKINGSVRTEATPSPLVPEKPAAPAFTWERISSYAIRSSDGRYTIDKASVRSKYRYTAWRVAREWRSALGSFDTPEEAKAIVEKDRLKGHEQDKRMAEADVRPET
jgi:hypothetical protein